MGIPAFRKYSPSVAPVDMTGMTGMPGHISLVTFSSAAMTSGRNGEASLCGASPIGETEIAGSSNTFINVARTKSDESPGKSRQLMIARAVSVR